MPNYHPPANAFAKGNQLYKNRLNTGRKLKFETPELLWQAARKYFRYCKDHPIPFYRSYRGKMVIIYKRRPMSFKELCAYLRITNLTYYKKLPDFTEVLGRIELVIYVHNYTAGMARLLAGRIYRPPKKRH